VTERKKDSPICFVAIVLRREDHVFPLQDEKAGLTPARESEDLPTRNVGSSARDGGREICRF
jgi:hypothetical protein